MAWPDVIVATSKAPEASSLAPSALASPTRVAWITMAIRPTAATISSLDYMTPRPSALRLVSPQPSTMSPSAEAFSALGWILAAASSAAASAGCRSPSAPAPARAITPILTRARSFLPRPMPWRCPTSTPTRAATSWASVAISASPATRSSASATRAALTNTAACTWKPRTPRVGHSTATPPTAHSAPGPTTTAHRRMESLQRRDPPQGA